MSHPLRQVLPTECDQIGRNFAIWVILFCRRQNFFGENSPNKMASFWAIFWREIAPIK